jgi:endoglucanase Acf2
VSEAINAWYGLGLLGKAMGDERIYDLGRLMLATELRAAHTYWQIDISGDEGGGGGGDEGSGAEGIYPPAFAANGVVAVVWSTKVDRSTWFGSNTEYTLRRHGTPFVDFGARGEVGPTTYGFGFRGLTRVTGTASKPCP